MTPRLPVPGQDSGQWGTLLNSFLQVEHNQDGTLVRSADIDTALTQANAAVNAVATASATADDAIAAANAALQPSEKGIASGIATLDSNSKLTSTQVPTTVLLKSSNPGDIGKAVDAYSGAAINIGPEVVVTSRSASFTVGPSDSGTLQKIASASAITITLPLNASTAIAVGAVFVFMRWGTGSVTVVAESEGTMTIGSDGNLRSIAVQYKSVVATKVGINEWLLEGDLV